MLIRDSHNQIYSAWWVTKISKEWMLLSRAFGAQELRYQCMILERKCAGKLGALSIRPKISEIPGRGANGTDIFRNFIPKFWVYLARLA